MKPHLVLVHSFPANSIMLSGLREFLEESFTVHLIDLPGFHPSVPPLARTSFEQYSTFVRERIDALGLPRYWLGGVSFGFRVANAVDVDDRCQGFIAFAPFLSARHIGLNRLQRAILAVGFGAVCALGLQRRVYASRVFSWAMGLAKPRHRIATMLETIDGYAFFETARMILACEDEPRFHRRPYVLVINTRDPKLSTAKVLDVFRRVDARVIHTTAEHSPEYPTREYFARTMDPSQLQALVEFVREQSLEPAPSAQ